MSQNAVNINSLFETSKKILGFKQNDMIRASKSGLIKIIETLEDRLIKIKAIPELSTNPSKEINFLEVDIYLLKTKLKALEKDIK